MKIWYYVDVTDGCGDLFLDSVLLIVDSLAPTLSFSPSDNFVSECINDSILVTGAILDSTIGVHNFFWNSGEFTESIWMQNNGTNFDTINYVLSLTDGCGKLDFRYCSIDHKF